MLTWLLRGTVEEVLDYLTLGLDVPRLMYV